MIDDNVLLNGHRQSRIIVGAAQIICIQPFGQLLSVDAPIGIQGGFLEQLNQLIFLANIVSAMQKGVRDLVDCSAYRLHLAHTGADSNSPILIVEVPVHASHILHENRNRRTALHRLHENLVILHAAG